MSASQATAPTEFHFDMELFIAEIQSEQAIWNYTSESYKNRTEKIKAWEKICMKLYPNFTEMNDKEKNDTVTLLQRKWKSLRDSYNRELNKLKKVKSVDDAFSKRRYIYFDQLSFLQPLAEQRITMGQQEEKETVKEDMVDSISDQVDAEIVEEMVAVQTPVPCQKKPLRASAAEVNGMDVLRSSRKCSKKKKSMSASPKHRDEDVLFCLSLVNDLKRLPDLLRTDAKCEMLQVLKRYKMSASSPLFQAAPPQAAHLPAYTDTSLLRLAQVEMGSVRKPRRTNCKYSPTTSSTTSDNDSVIQQMF